MQDAKEEVRARLAIEDVIGEYVDLKRAGRNFKGLSPFSGEKTPSFFVSPEKNIWHDFSSNKGGDVFSFVMEAEGLDFREALELLARKANIDLSVYQNAKSKDIAKKKKRLLEANKLAAHYYQHALLKNQHAIDYVFKQRGLDRQIVQDFQIGYAPSGNSHLVQFLTKKGFTKYELKDAGLTNRFGGDLFRGRMMVPLMDASGQVIGFTGRILTDEPNAPKYLNTPQTLLYDKSWHVFGLSQAKEAIRTRDYAVIVEGNMDTVSSHQADVKQVVATAGTAMTIHHLKTLSRLASHIRLAFDADKAGIAATERAIPIAQEAGIELSIISLSHEAKDPDELIKKDVSLWQAAIESAEPVLDWLLRQYEHRYDITSAEGKRKYTTAGLTIVNALHDPVEKEHYLQKISGVTNTRIATLQQKMSKQTAPPDVNKKVVHSDNKTEVNQYEVSQNSVLSLGLVSPAARQHLVDVSEEYFTGDSRRQVIDYLRSASQETVTDVPPQLKNIEEFVKLLLLQADARYGEWTSDDCVHETSRLLRLLKREHLKNIKQKLDDDLRSAETHGDDDSMAKIIKEIQMINKELNS